MMSTYFDFNDGNGSVPARRHKNSNGEIGGWVADSAIIANKLPVSQKPFDAAFAKPVNEALQ